MEKRRRPNIDDPAELAAYKQELRRLMRVPRILGLLLIAIGTGLVIYARRAGVEGPMMPIGWALIGFGWLNLFLIIYYRTRYHRARMAEDPEAF
jgi:hypothetical protein